MHISSGLWREFKEFKELRVLEKRGVLFSWCRLKKLEASSPVAVIFSPFVESGIFSWERPGKEGKRIREEIALRTS